jgi:dipeptidyl aminopeptidase/acylaminoacyl peptidase
VSAVAFNPDGTTLATGAFDARARLWDVATGGTLAILEEQAFKSVAISPDGTRLATGSIAGASLWDVATGERLARLVGHEGIVACVGFSPDGTRLATGSSDTTVRLWDTATGKELVVLRGHEGTVESVAFIRDGAGLATASWDGTIRLWGLSNAEMNRNRRAAAERRERLGPTVDGWFAGDLDDVKAKLAAAKETMPPEDWHEAGNLVLMRAHARRHAIDATGDPARASGQRNAATPSLGGPTANPASGPTATETAPSRGNPASSGNDPGAPAAVAVPE